MKIEEIPLQAPFKLDEETFKKFHAEWLQTPEWSRMGVSFNKDTLLTLEAPIYKDNAPGSLQLYIARKIAHGPTFCINVSRSMHQLLTEAILTDEPNVSPYLPSRSYIMTSCDPEYFLEDQQGNFVAPFDDTKWKPVPMDSGTGSMYLDGLAVEISPAVRQCHEEVLNRMGNILRTIPAGGGFGALGTGNKLKISAKTLVEIPTDILENSAIQHIQLGCVPSMSAYGLPSFTTDEPRKLKFRAAGGHVHLGTPHSASWIHRHAERIVKAMDAIAGVAAVAAFADIDDPRRRLYYGKAGEYRLPKHGLEYRVLSNAWTWHPAVAHLILNLVRGAFRFGATDWTKDFSVDEDRVRGIIDMSDSDEAKKYVKEHKSFYSDLLNKDSGYSWGTRAVNAIIGGFKNRIPMEDIQENWQLGATKFNDFSVPHKKVIAAATAAVSAVPAR